MLPPSPLTDVECGNGKEKDINTINMHKKEKTLEIKIQETIVSDTKSQFTIGPFDIGIATTAGNSLRRILLTSIYGFSVYAINIKGVAHEFVALPNINIDLQLLILNLKKLVISAKNLDVFLEKPTEIKFKCRPLKKGIVTASDLICPPEFEIINKDFEIFRTFKDNAIEIDLLVRYGRGFESFSRDIKLIKNAPIGYIPIQANYSPIKNVMFEVHEHVTKSNVQYNNLEMTVVTNGSIKGSTALNLACVKLIDLFNGLLKKKHSPKNDITAVEINPKLSSQINAKSDLNDLPVEKLILSERTCKALRKDNIKVVGDILKRTRLEIQRIHNLGPKSFIELFEALDRLKLDTDFLKKPLRTTTSTK